MKISPENVRKKAKSIPLMWKVNITGMLMIFFFTFFIHILLIPFMEREKLVERSGKLRAVVNSAVSLIDYYEQIIRRSGWDPAHGMPTSITDAKTETLRKLRELRYDKTEFLFILDGDGNMIMHPTKPELEGRNMMEIKDPDGIPLFRKMVIDSQKEGETLVQYRWESKYSPSINEPQISYARYYWQWDWVICSSLYIQDITDAMKELKFRTAMYELLVAVPAMVLLFLFVHFYLNRPLKKLLSGIGEIRNGNLKHRIEVSAMDEVGVISNEFNSMVKDLSISSEKLIKSEKKYREMTDLLPDIIYESDSTLRVTYVNKAGLRLTGYTREDIKRGVYLKDLVESEDYRKFTEIFNNGKVKKYFFRHKILRKDGSSFYGENSMSIFHEQENEVLLRGSIRDTSEKQKFEEQLMQSQKMETIGILAGGIAHDFNNVLGGIVGTISLMKYEIQKSPALNNGDFRNYLEIMEQSAGRATDMVRQLLTLSRKTETELIPVDLTTAVKNVTKICRNTLDKSITITSEIKDESAFILADPTQIDQVLLNLCVNAGHAMTIMRRDDEPEGGNLSLALEKITGDKTFCEIHPEAEVRNYWMISVGDTGVGMDSQTIAHIFVPFFTTKDKGAGTGLGLSMVYNIIQQHGGFINVYSEKGSGSTFTVYLPAYEGNDRQDENPASLNNIRGEGLILVIDDEELMRRIAEKILRRCGYSVLTASGGDEGIKLFREKHREISAVLLDLAMPRMSGDMVYDRLKEIDDKVRVILASGFRQDERVDAALKKGINLFIQKPYTLEKLADTVKKLIQTAGQE